MADERARRFELFAAAYEPLLRCVDPQVSRLELYSRTVQRFNELDPRLADCVGFLAGRRVALLQGPQQSAEEAEATVRGQLRALHSDPRQLALQHERSTNHFNSAWPSSRPPSRRIVAWEIFAGEEADNPLDAWEKLSDDMQRKYLRFEKLWNENVVIRAKNGDDEDEDEDDDDEEEAREEEEEDDDDDDDEFIKRRKPKPDAANPKPAKLAKTRTKANWKEKTKKKKT